MTRIFFAWHLFVRQSFAFFLPGTFSFAKVLWGGQGGGFSKEPPWPPEAFLIRDLASRFYCKKGRVVL
jgi:hypothetical protein